MPAKLCAVLAAVACGCSSMPKNPAAAPGALAIHGEGQGWTNFKERGDVASADIGFEYTNCCSAGFYLATANGIPVEFDEKAEHNADDSVRVLGGGGEVGVVIPGCLENYVRLRARFGKAGTAPRSPFLGRSGFGASGTLLVRLLGSEPPSTAEARPTIDLTIGYSRWAVGYERTSAGRYDDLGDANASALTLGLRLGASYGVNFEPANLE